MLNLIEYVARKTARSLSNEELNNMIGKVDAKNHESPYWITKLALHSELRRRAKKNS